MTRHAPDESAAQLFATFRAGYQALGQLLEQHRAYVLQIVNDIRRQVGMPTVSG